MSQNSLFDFSNLPPQKRKGVVDDVRNILIIEFPGDKAGENSAKALFEELQRRGYKIKIMT